MFCISAVLRRLATAALAMAVTVGAAASARADFIFRNTDSDGFTTVKVYDDDGNWKGTHYYGPEMEYFGSKYPDGDPNPEGDSGGGLSDDAIDAFLDMLKKLGGGLVETDPFNNPIGRGLIEQGKVPGAEIDPWDVLGYDEFGGSGGGGGFDPNVPIGEQLPKSTSRDSDDDDDDHSRPGSPPENADPELIDPPPMDVEVLDLTGVSLTGEESAELDWYLTFVR